MRGGAGVGDARSHSPAGTRAARTSHSMAYAMAMAATPSLGATGFGYGAQQVAPAMPSMALPSKGNMPLACAAKTLD